MPPWSGREGGAVTVGEGVADAVGVEVGVAAGVLTVAETAFCMLILPCMTAPTAKPPMASKMEPAMAGHTY